MPRIFYPDDFADVPPTPGFDSALLQSDCPNAHIALYGADNACCSVWWGAAPQGCIGHFFADNNAAAEVILQEAIKLLANNNCKEILAPMNGNTWREYRYAVLGADKPRFLMEPPLVLGREKFLINAGFSLSDSYYSYDESLENAQENPPDIPGGITLRSLDITRLEQELEGIYGLAITAFSQNPYYSPVSREVFVRQYLAYEKMLLPDLILIAEDNGRTVGFLFCIPDFLQGERPDTILLKTIAVLPEYRSCGLGGCMMETAKHRAAQIGFARCIYALVYEKNASRKFCRGAELLREYSLFRRTL